MTANSRLRRFVVSQVELKCLEQIVLDDVSLREPLKEQVQMDHGEFVVTMNPEQAEKVREYLTERLAREGFADDYSLNEKGKALEDLLDRFYIP